MPRNIKTLEPTDNSLVQVFITCKTLTLTLILIQFLRKHQKFSNLSNKMTNLEHDVRDIKTNLEHDVREIRNGGSL